jgi:tripartite-type tricarboxylate transporter receptor subunit TctC
MILSRLIAALLAGASLVSAASAQEKYPSQPITWIIPYAPGGGTDVIARPLSLKVAEALGQAIVYENRPGAAGFIAGAAVAKAAPDGYTYLVAAGNTHIFSTLLFDKVPFDPVKDFAPVTQFATIPNILVANPQFPPNNIKELVAYGKKNPGKINWASSGNGAGGHLGLVLFAKNAGIKVVHVPFKGAGPAHASVLAGNTHLLLANTGVFLSNIKAGKLKVLGTAAQKRLEVLSDVPTFAEQGYPLESASFYGLMAPAGTPRAIIGKMHGAIVKVLKTPQELKRLADNGAFPVGNTPEEFAAYLKQEVDTWRPVIRDNNIKPG